MPRPVQDILFELRNEKKESQETVADSIGATRVTYTRYENGTRKPDAVNAVKLAWHFNVSVAYLLGMQEEKNDSGMPQAAPSDNFALSSREKELLNSFRKLNAETQENFMSLIVATAASPIAQEEAIRSREIS